MSPHDPEGLAGLGEPSQARARIAVFAGPTATILNSAPLGITNTNTLRPQRLAAPAIVYVEPFSGHPLEADASHLYAPADGYLDAAGQFVQVGTTGVPADARPVYRVVLDHRDGLFLLPYPARPADGESWCDDPSRWDLEPGQFRQTQYPDASRPYEEIDRFGIERDGRSGLLSELADFSHVRVLPPAGYESTALAGAAGLDRPELRGVDYFGYVPVGLRAEPDRAALVRATNIVQQTMETMQMMERADESFVGAQWLEGSPTAEESLYWLNLVVDTDRPIVGHTAQRPHGLLGADGGRQIVDGARYLTSRIWADAQGRDRIGAVLVVDQRIFTAREVVKTDARSGNYDVAGGHGGIVGSTGGAFGGPLLTFLPTRLHTFRSQLRVTALPAVVLGVRRTDAGELVTSEVEVRASTARLADGCIPAVKVIKFSRYDDDCCTGEEVKAWRRHSERHHPLAGVVGEGQSPYGWLDPVVEEELRVASFSGMPVVKVGRGNTMGFASRQAPWFVRGTNLTATKARVLLMAAMLRLGALPLAREPEAPTPSEVEATAAAVRAYQDIFDSH